MQGPHARKYQSLSQSWALLISSVILFIPANILPIMTVYRIDGDKTDTIFSGVINLMNSGMLPIAVIVFIASIVVPLFKMCVLFGLLLSVSFDLQLSARFRTRLYRLIEFVGRWSMLDIYVITILITLVSYGKLATIETGIASTSFAAVVILTMLAVLRFDSRLLWDADHD